MESVMTVEMRLDLCILHRAPLVPAPSAVRAFAYCHSCLLNPNHS